VQDPDIHSDTQTAAFNISYQSSLIPHILYKYIAWSLHSERQQ